MLVVVCGMWLASAVGVSAQEFRATIIGRVTDSAGAAIAGARVSVVNIATNTPSDTLTSEEGVYSVPSLPPGQYRLEVEQTNFKKFVQSGITLQIGDNPTIDVTLEPGALGEVVTVTSDASPLEANDASRGTVVTGRAVTDLPLNGRNAFALAALSPGVSINARGQASTFLRTTANNGISAISINGGQNRSNEALLDGVPNTGSDGLIQFVPSSEATQEFKVQTNSFDAEFGRFTGGVINATIKSGSNDFNGSLFEFLRNSRLNARDPFATDRPQFGYNLFGGTVGGPVVLPRFGEGGPAFYNGRDRTFFFVSYEGSREGVPRAFVSTVPTALQRQGNFTETPGVLVYDPATTRPGATAGSFTRTAFAGNIIPQGRISPIASNLLALVPLPNAPGTVNNLRLSYKDPVSDDGYVVKIDHNFSERHRIFGRFSRRKFTVGRAGGFRNPLTADEETRTAPGFAFDDTYTLNATTILNFRYGFTRFFVNAAPVGEVDASSLGFPSSFTNVLPVQSFPRIRINGFSNFGEANRLNRAAEDTHTVRGGATKIAGNQTFRFGGEFRLLRSNNGSRGAVAAGSFDFNSAFTRQNPAANANTPQQSLAAFLLGLPNTGSVENNAATAEQATYYGFYVQDDFRVTQRLTLNLGLRYEFEGANTERYDRFNRGFDTEATLPIDTQARAAYAAAPVPQLAAADFRVRGGLLFAGVNGSPRGVTDIDRNNFGPRVGAAFQLDDKTVLRGGFGFFYGATTLLSEGRVGFSVATPIVGTTDNINSLATLNNPLPSGLIAASGSTLGASTLIGTGISFVDTERQQPYTRQYQVSIQRELPSQILLDAAYVGSSGRDLPVDQQINGIPESFRAQARQAFVASGGNVNISTQNVTNPFRGLIPSVSNFNGANIARGQLLRPFPQFTSVVALNRSIGSSRYDAFQFKATRRFAQGFNLTSAYTFAKQLNRTRFLNDQDAEPVKEVDEFDTPHRLVISSVFELPLGPGKRFGGDTRGLVGKLLEGYQLNVIYQAQSGIPLTFISAEQIADPLLSADERTTARYFNTAAFRLRQPLELVATSRLSYLRSPGRNNFDISLFKNVSITEDVRLQLRAEGINIFNRAEFSSPNTDFNSPNFGAITSTNTFARQFQLGVRFLF